jgi:hypothetical protein
MANRICQFAKNRTDIKIVKFGPQSEFCKSLRKFDKAFEEYRKLKRMNPIQKASKSSTTSNFPD